MENQEQPENSDLAQQGVIPGCWRGMFLSIEVNQSLLLRKMLGERRNGDGKRLGGMKASEKIVETLPGGDQTNHPNTRPSLKLHAVEEAELGGKTEKNLLRRLNPLEIYKKYRVLTQKGKKLKPDPPSRRFSRTISIHHLECNDYVPSDQIEPEESSRCLNGQRRLDILGHQLHENQDEFPEKLQETNKRLLEKQLSEKCYPVGLLERPGVDFKRSSSYPGPVTESQRDCGSTVHRLEDRKQRMRDLTKENARISLDGVLHKIPYGSTPYWKKFSLLEGSDAHGNFSRMRRTQSLTESPDIYSQLLESNFNKQESRREKSLKTFGRISSLPNVESYHFPEDNHNEISSIFLKSQSFSLDQDQETVICDESDKLMAEDVTSPFYDTVESNNQREPRSVSKEFSFSHGSEIKPDNSEGQQYTTDDSLSDANGQKIPDMHVDFDALHSRVEPKHEAVFLHLVEVLKTYGSSGTELAETNISLEPRLDYPISGNLDQELVSDLIHEVLLEILESSCGQVSTKSMILVLKHAWEDISWHLDSQQEADDGLEYIVERDFKKDLGWMKLGHDIEDVGLDLEAVILDDLTNEILMDFFLNSA